MPPHFSYEYRSEHGEGLNQWRCNGLREIPISTVNHRKAASVMGGLRPMGAFPAFVMCRHFAFTHSSFPSERSRCQPSDDDLKEFINKTSGRYRLQICISKITVWGPRWSRRGTFRYYQKFVQLLTDRSISMSSVQQAAGLYSPKIW